MSPGGRARLDQRLAVLEVGADRRRDDARGLRHRRDGVPIPAVGDHERPVDAQLGASLLELVPGAPAEGHPQAGRRMLGEVGGREYADEAGCPIEDDVVIAV